MIIVGDIGNTVTKVCLVNNKKKIIKRFSFDTKKINLKKLNYLFNKINIKKNKVKKCLFCSVVPKSFKFLKIFLSKKYKLKCYELKNLSINRFIEVKVNRKQIGSDRLANAISVANKSNNFIILDFGTATTFDVLIKNVYHGGVIAPGLELSLSTLTDNASLIPYVNLKKTKKVIGLNTISAVRSGFFWGYKGLINNIINLIEKETRKSFKIIITGGFSYLFKNLKNSKIKLNKDITINGLIKATKLIN